jgi:ADP-ribose pyrophosphatase
MPGAPRERGGAAIDCTVWSAPREDFLDHPPAPWTVLDRTYLHRSPWRSFAVERVLTHQGAEIAYSFLEAPDGVYVVPLTSEGQIVLLRQYRLPVRQWLWEVPSGSVGDEAPADAGRRELAEEIGGTCSTLEPVGACYGLPSSVTSRHYFFLATGVTLGPSRHDPTELLDIVPVAADEALAWARSGQIDATGSAFALLLCEPLIRRHLAEG